MKKFVFISLVLVLMLSMVFAALKDVPANHWATPAINSLVSKGIIAGYPDGTYRGKAFITRYQMAVVLDKAVNYLESSLAKVEDSVSAIQGFNNDISFLYKKLGIVSDKLENTASTNDLNEVKATLNAVFKTVSINNQQTNDSITGLSNIVYSNKDKLMGISEKVVDLEKTVSGLNYSNDLDLIYSKLAALKELQFNQVKDIKDLQNEATSLNYLSKSVKDNQAAINSVALSLGSTLYNLQGTVSANTDSIKSIQEKVASLNDLSASVKDNQAAINSVALSLGSTIYNMQDTVNSNSDSIESLQASVKNVNSDLTNLQASVKNVNSDLTKLSSSVSENGKTAKSASSMAMMALVVGIVGIALGAYAAFK